MKKRTSFIALAIGVLLTALAFGVWDHYFKKQPARQEAQTQSTQKKDLATTDKRAQAVTTPTSTSKSTPATSPAYTPPANNDNITLNISQPDSSQVVVSTRLTGYSDGNCSLLVVNGTKSLTQTATLMFQREFSTCAGFTVPTSNLGTGPWKLTLTVTSGGINTSKSVDYEVK